MGLSESDLGKSCCSRTGNPPYLSCVGGTPEALTLALPDTGP